MMDWKRQIYKNYLSTHYRHLNSLNVINYDLHVEGYGHIWDQYLPQNRNTCCLDLGCGTGMFLYYLRSRGFAHIEGVDLSQENSEIARSLDFTIVTADAVDYLSRAYTSGKSYGLIAALDVIEHLTREELLKLLNWSVAVLEPGGRMLIKTLNASSLIGFYGRYMDITHELAFSEETLRQVLLCAGFSQVQFAEGLKHGVKERIRYGLKRTLYWGIYRLIEGRPVPKVVDLDITVVGCKL